MSSTAEPKNPDAEAMDIVELQRWGADRMELTAATSTVFASQPAVAFLLGRSPIVVRWDGEAFIDPAGPIDLGGVYRADVFNGVHHLRWYRPQGRGVTRSAVVTEDRGPLSDFDDHEATSCRRLTQRYLLWPPALPAQASRPLPPGWCWMGEARTATFAVPIDHDPAARTQLDVCEYLVVDPVVTDAVDGNAYVIDERFVGLNASDSQAGAQPPEQDEMRSGSEQTQGVEA